MANEPPTPWPHECDNKCGGGWHVDRIQAPGGLTAADVAIDLKMGGSAFDFQVRELFTLPENPETSEYYVSFRAVPEEK